MQRALLYLLVAASYLLLAGGPAWALGCLLPVAAAGALMDAPRTWQRLSRPEWLERGWLLLLLASVLQLLPLPVAALDQLSPHARDLRQALVLTSGVDAWVPISIAPWATARAVGSLALGLLAYLGARALLDVHGGVRALCRALAWGGAVAALVAAVQRAAAPTLLMGLVTPEAPNARPFGPFVNRNHFAAWLLLASAVAAGYFVAHLRLRLARHGPLADQIRRVLGTRAAGLFAAISAMAAVLLLTLSRSGAVGLGAATMSFWWVARRRVDWPRTGWALTGIAGAALLMGAAVVDLDAWAARLDHTFTAGPRPDGRLVIWRESWPIVRDFWLTGAGAGTYGTAMLTYQQSRIWVPHLAAWAHFNQAHNHPLQVLAEGGLLLALPAAMAGAGLIAAGRRALAGDRTEIFWIRAGAAAGLAGVAVQSLWEIPLTMPANAVLAAVLAAILLHHPRAEPRQRPRGDQDASDDA